MGLGYGLFSVHEGEAKTTEEGHQDNQEEDRDETESGDCEVGCEGHKRYLLVISSPTFNISAYSA